MEKKKENKKEEKAEKEEITEVFEIEKEGKEKIVETHGTAEEKSPSPEQIKKEKKIFLVLVMSMGFCVLVFLSIYFIMKLSNQFEYNGVNFIVDKKTMTGTTLYRTSIPVSYNGSQADYNLYLRKDPRALSLIPFNGTLNIASNMVVNMTGDFNCNGDGIIGMANLLKLYGLVGTNVIQDANATCDSEGKYMFLRIEEGNETKIEQFGPSCYKIYIKNCEMLEGTERFMIETLVKINKVIKESS